MGTTPNFTIPYPEKTDPRDVPLDLKELAEQIDTIFKQAFATAAMPSPVGNAGRRIFVTDLGLPAYSDGTRWLIQEKDVIRQVQAGFTENGTAFAPTSETFTTRITDQDGLAKWALGWRPRCRILGLIQCSTSNIAYAALGMWNINVGDTGVGGVLSDDTLVIQESAGAGINYMAKSNWTLIDDANVSPPGKSIFQFAIRTRVSGGVGTYNHMYAEVVWVYEP